MLIDINTWVGHWPFRQLRGADASGLLKRMDKKGIDRRWLKEDPGPDPDGLNPTHLHMPPEGGSRDPQDPQQV